MTYRATLKLPYDRPPISQNSRMHWAPANKIKQEIKRSSAWLARSEKMPHLERIRVTIEWIVNDRRRRDVDNMAPTLKAAIDGLVQAGVITDDDYTRVETAYRIVHAGIAAHAPGLYLHIEETP